MTNHACQFDARAPVATVIAPRWVWLAATLLSEYVMLSVAFDAAPLVRHAGVVGSVAPLGMFVPLLFAIATAACVTTDGGLRRDLQAFSLVRVPKNEALRFLGLHGACLAVFVWLTYRLSSATAAELGHPAAYLCAWAIVGITANVVLVRVAMPARMFVRLLRSFGAYVGVSLTVGIAAWTAGMGTERLWQPLGGLTLTTTTALLGLVTPEVLTEPARAMIGTPEFSVTVAPQCSGYEGIGLILIFVPAYLWFMRHSLRFPRAFLLIPASVAIVWLANAVRIAALIMVGTHLSEEVAFGAFHSKAGWLLFCTVALGTSAVGQRSRFFAKDAAVPSSVEYWNPTAAYLAPLVALIAIAMTTGLFAIDVDPLYGLGVLAALAALWRYRSLYRDLRLSGSWSAAALGVAVFLIWIALEPASATTIDSPAFAERWSSSGFALWVVVRVLGSCLVIPIVEELAFRGYLLRRLISADFTEVAFERFTWISFLGSSAAFGVLHQNWVAAVAAGMIFAFAQYRRGRLSDAIVAHAVANACIAACVLGWGRWSLWI